MYALIVFTLGWPAPEPVSTYSRIEVCQATKAVMSHALTGSGFRGARSSNFSKRALLYAFQRPRRVMVVTKLPVGKPYKHQRRLTR